MVLSKEKLNYYRTVSLIVDKATPILRNVLVQFAPLHQGKGSFQDVLNDQTIKDKLKAFKNNVLNIKDCQRIYPPGGAPADPEQFDFTLLIVLIRNLCTKFIPPPDGWDKLPKDKNNKTLEAQIARLKHYRNQTISHKPKAEIQTVDFDPTFTHIKDALLSMDGHLPKPTGITDSDLEDIRTMVLFSEEEQNTLSKVVEDWENHDKDLKEEFKNLGIKVIEKVEKKGGKVDSVGGKIDSVGGKVDSVGGKVDSVGGKVDSVGGKVDSVGGKVDSVGGKVEAVGGRVETVLLGLKQDLKHELQNIHNAVTEGKEANTCKSSPECAAPMLQPSDQYWMQHQLQNIQNAVTEGKETHTCKSTPESAAAPTLLPSDKSSFHMVAEDLRNYYKRHSRIKVKPWDPNYTVQMSEGYREPQVKKHEFRFRDVKKEILKTPYDMLITLDGASTFSVNCQGDSGKGKSTFKQKLCYDWAIGQVDELKRFQLVVSLVLNMVTKDQDLCSILKEQLLPEVSYLTDPEQVKQQLRDMEEKLLFVLDVYDEYDGKNSTVNDIINRKVFTKANILLLSRPWKCHDLKEYTVFELNGHKDEEEVLGCVTQYFSGDPKADPKKFMEQICRRNLMDLMITPLFLVMTCSLYLDEGHKLPENLTGMYTSLMDLSFHSNLKSQDCKIKCPDIRELLAHKDLEGCPEEDKRQKVLSKILCYVGKLSLEVMLNKEGGVLQKREEEDPRFKAALDRGFISVQKVKKGTAEYSKLTFPHKTFQEYFTAVYLGSIEEDDADMGKFKEIVQTTDQIFEQEMVLLFYIGLFPARKQAILQQVDDILEKDSTLEKIIRWLQDTPYKTYIYALENNTYGLTALRACTNLESKLDFEGGEESSQLLYQKYLFISPKDLYFYKSNRKKQLRPNFCVLKGVEQGDFRAMFNKIDLSTTDVVHINDSKISDKSFTRFLDKLKEGQEVHKHSIVLEDMIFPAKSLIKQTGSMLQQPHLKRLQLKRIHKDLGEIDPSTIDDRAAKSSTLEELAIVQCDKFVAQLWLTHVCEMVNLETLQAPWPYINEFIKGLHQSSSKLSCLSVDNREMDSSGKSQETSFDAQISAGLVLQQYSHLKRVEFFGCDVTASPMISPSEPDSTLKESRLEEVLFQECKLETQEDSDPFQGLEMYSELNSIEFRNNTISVDALENLGLKLPAFPKLKSLRFMRNKGVHGNMKKLFRNLHTSHFTAMTQLSLEDCVKTKEDMSYIVELLRLCPKLNYLSLNNILRDVRCQVTDDCFQPLVEADVLPNTLKNLFLIGLKIGKYIGQFIEQLQDLEKLVLLTLNDNELGENSQCLVETLQDDDNWSDMKQIGLCNNHIDRELKERFSEVAKTRPGLHVQFDLHES